MGSGSGPASDVSLNTILPDEIRDKYINPGLIRDILMQTQTIAVVGLSPRKQRPSNFVATYLTYEGYRVIPVNPRATEILGEKAYPDLLRVPDPIDLVNIFRRPEECVDIVKEAIQIGAKAVWMQLRVINLEAAKLAEEAGLKVVMDRCIKIEHGRYNGSLHWVGMNTELISARKTNRFI